METPRRKRKHLSHFIPHWIPGKIFFFVTINCVPRGFNQLCHDAMATKILSSVDYYHHQLKWHAALFLLMPDHVHGIVAFPRDVSMKSVIRAWKSYHKRFHSVRWQSDFFDHRLRDRHSFEEKFDYTLKNPVRAGLCERPEDWPYVYRPMDRPLF